MDFSYIAGFLDADGSITVRSRLGARPDLSVSITQRVEYRDIVDKVHGVFGGHIYVKNEKYIGWTVRSKMAKACLELLLPHLVLKKRHAEQFIELVNTASVLQTKQDQESIRSLVKSIRSQNNHLIDNDMSWSWLAGYFDGDGCFSTSIKSGNGYGYPSACILAAPNYKSGLDFIKSMVGGNMCSIGRNFQWSLPVSMKPRAQNFLISIAPYLVIKKPQADFLIECSSRGGFLDGAGIRRVIMALNGRKSNAPFPSQKIDDLADSIDFSIEKKFLFKTDFVEHANKIHKNIYDYSKSIYISTKLRLVVTCKMHGDFTVVPNDHLNGRGCPACSKLSYGVKRRLSFSEFIERAIGVHGGKYNYAEGSFNQTGSVVIDCKIHGEFTQDIFNHLNGSGCPQCSYLASFKTNFVEDAILKHAGFYDYSKTVYLNTKTKVTITCPVHGDFQRTPWSHLQGYGCLKCSKLRPRPESKKKTNLEGYAERARLVHGDAYHYDSLVRVGRKINITCPLHGVFLQDMFNHLRGSKCPVCSRNPQKKHP